MELTSGAISPELFRRWSAISLIAGTLERRVWTQAGDFQTFANLYVMLVAPPGVGKQVIKITRDLWQKICLPGTTNPALSIAPNSVTKAALMDVLGEAKKSFLPPTGAMVTYHSLQIAADEFGVLLPAYDQEFIASLNEIYDNGEFYKERRRQSNVRQLYIDFPQLNILAGATPGYFVGTFPETAWTTGLARRLIMVYSSDTPFKELWQESPNRDIIRTGLVKRLSQLAGAYGQMVWHADATTKLAAWHRAGEGKGGPPIPTHSKLEHYIRSRTMFAIKLSMISGIARTGILQVELSDVLRAIDWLLEAESLMPDVFRAMAGRSDVQVIEELHYFVQARWARDRQKPVSGVALREFLLQRVPHDKIESILLVADRANIISRIANTDTWLPRPKHEHGVE